MSNSDDSDVAERLLALLDKLDMLTARWNQIERDSAAWESFESNYRSLVDRRRKFGAPAGENDQAATP